MKERETQYILGVSLGNRTFDNEFAGRLFNWLIGRGGSTLDIVIGDVLERVNYRVRRGTSEEEATRASQKRARDLATMFLAAAEGKEIDVEVVIESESGYRGTSPFKNVADDVFAAYQRKGRFYGEVNEQVRKNLLHVSMPQLIEQRIEELAGYVLEELALFAAYFSQHPTAIEVYPGENLAVKEKMFRGEYRPELMAGRLEKIPEFIDVSQLSRPRHPSQGRDVGKRKKQKSNGQYCTKNVGESSGLVFRRS